MATRVQVRTITDDERTGLLRLVRRSSGSVVTWRRAQIVLLSAQGLDVARIANVVFSSPDRVRDAIHKFNALGFDSIQPNYAGGRPRKFTPPQRQRIRETALTRPRDHGLPFSTWSLAKLADYLITEGVVDDISNEGLRQLLREEGVNFQAVSARGIRQPRPSARVNRSTRARLAAGGARCPRRGCGTQPDQARRSDS